MEEISFLIATCAFCGEKYPKEKLGEDGHRCKEMEENSKERCLEA